MTRTIPHATRLAATAAAALLTISALTACSDDETDAPSTSSQSSPDANDKGSSKDEASGKDAPGTDESKAVFAAYTKPEPIASTTNEDGQTFEVFKVQDTPNGTVMSFRVSKDGGTSVLMGWAWDTYPDLVDESDGTAYQPITVRQIAFGGQPQDVICLCTATSIIGDPAMPQYVLYESLPDDLDKVRVRYSKTDVVRGIGGFDPVTVEVTR